MAQRAFVASPVALRCGAIDEAVGYIAQFRTLWLARGALGECALIGWTQRDTALHGLAHGRASLVDATQTLHGLANRVTDGRAAWIVALEATLGLTLLRGSQREEEPHKLHLLVLDAPVAQTK